MPVIPRCYLTSQGRMVERRKLSLWALKMQHKFWEGNYGVCDAGGERSAVRVGEELPLRELPDSQNGL